MTLIVSLPVNDMELARLAWENGADFIKVHTNVFHNASKGHRHFDEQLVPEGIVETSPFRSESCSPKILRMPKG